MLNKKIFLGLMSSTLVLMAGGIAFADDNKDEEGVGTQLTSEQSTLSVTDSAGEEYLEPGSTMEDEKIEENESGAEITGTLTELPVIDKAGEAYLAPGSTVEER